MMPGQGFAPLSRSFSSRRVTFSGIFRPYISEDAKVRMAFLSLSRTLSQTLFRPPLRRLVSILFITLTALAAGQSQPATKPSANQSRESILRTVAEIKRADYEGDRAALKRLHGELTPLPDDKFLASRVLYWRGFALWRRAINGFNETPTPTDLADDLNGAVTDFKDSLAQDPTYVESKIGEASSFGYLAYLNMKDPARMQELIQQSSPLLKDAMASDPDNPRLLWVLGPIRWSSPPERGGGQDKAFDLYNRGLEAIRKRPAGDALDPSWGEPELLMNRAWSNLHRTEPDLKSAQKDAEAALALVPYWHYVRDILLPQIREAEAKAEAKADAKANGKAEVH